MANLVKMPVAAFMQTPRRFSEMASVSRGTKVVGMSEKLLGTVKCFNDDEGHGFITPVDDSDDVFVHFTAIETKGFRTLLPGQAVSFRKVSGPRGVEAGDVRIAD